MVLHEQGSNANTNVFPFLDLVFFCLTQDWSLAMGCNGCHQL
jgi:hypothetical protein